MIARDLARCQRRGIRLDALGRENTRLENLNSLIRRMASAFRILVCCLCAFAMNSEAILGDDAAEKPLAKWISPNGLYTAKVEILKGPPDVRLTVEQTNPDKSIIGDVEQFDSAEMHPLSPQFIGIWSPTGDRFCLFTGRDVGSITGKLIALQTRAPFFPSERILPQFVLMKTFSIIYGGQDGTQAKIDSVNHFLTKLHFDELG